MFKITRETKKKTQTKVSKTNIGFEISLGDVFRILLFIMACCGGMSLYEIIPLFLSKL